MSDHLEINTMIYDNEKNIYKYNIDYIRGNHAIMSMMAVYIENIYPNERESIFNIKTENHSHNISKDLHININYKSQLYFTDDIIGNSALFDLIEVSFSDDFFTDLDKTKYDLIDNTSLNIYDIEEIINQKGSLKPTIIIF